MEKLDYFLSELEIYVTIFNFWMSRNNLVLWNGERNNDLK